MLARAGREWGAFRRVCPRAGVRCFEVYRLKIAVFSILQLVKLTSNDFPVTKDSSCLSLTFLIQLSLPLVLRVRQLSTRITCCFHSVRPP